MWVSCTVIICKTLMWTNTILNCILLNTLLCAKPHVSNSYPILFLPALRSLRFRSTAVITSRFPNTSTTVVKISTAARVDTAQVGRPTARLCSGSSSSESISSTTVPPGGPLPNPFQSSLGSVYTATVSQIWKRSDMNPCLIDAVEGIVTISCQWHFSQLDGL